jgi:hypothetical protein
LHERCAVPGNVTRNKEQGTRQATDEEERQEAKRVEKVIKFSTPSGSNSGFPLLRISERFSSAIFRSVSYIGSLRGVVRLQMIERERRSDPGDSVKNNAMVVHVAGSTGSILYAASGAGNGSHCWLCLASVACLHLRLLLLTTLER